MSDWYRDERWLDAPRHVVSAAVTVTNSRSELLMVKSPRRGWEIPGGQVELSSAPASGLGGCVAAARSDLMAVRRAIAPAGLSLAGHGLEDELVGFLVEEEDGRGLGAEDRARHLDGRLQKRAVRLVGSEHTCCDGCFEIAHAAPFALEAGW